MAGTNQYLSFAAAPGANVLTPAAYAALLAQQSGFSSGILPSVDLNTPIRQATVGVAALAQLAADQNINMSDDGSATNFKANLLAAIRAAVAPERLRNIIHPSIGGEGWKDIVRGGWRPAFFNQQWGGAPMPFWLTDAATGAQHKIEAATGYIEFTGFGTLGDLSSDYYKSSGFKVPQTGAYAAIWLRMYKVGSANRNIALYIYTDNGSGSPSALVANGTATPINMMAITSDTAGHTYRFEFPTPPTLTGGTQYHFVLTQSATDAANYIEIANTNTSVGGFNNYPYGFINNATSALVWTQVTTGSLWFIVEPAASLQMLQAGGIFDSQLKFWSGATLNQSGALINDASRVWDGKELTLNFVGSGWPASATFFDMLFGLDHDRIVLTTSATGQAVLTVYTTSSSTMAVTGTTDLRTGNHSVMAHVRSAGDGADSISLLVDGISEGTPWTSQSVSFDPLFQQLGTAWIGGGFPLAPTWTQKIGAPFTQLPSLSGWTHTGTGVEANCWSVQGGRLMQNKNGYAATDSSYYVKATAGFSNGPGGTAVIRRRVLSSPNDSNSAAHFAIADGTRKVISNAQEYYCVIVDGASTLQYAQTQMKSQDSVEAIVTISNRGYVFKNGRLLSDMDGKLVGTTANNQVEFGDTSTVSGSNADVSYAYIAYYNVAALLPVFSAGLSLSEFAAWTGNQTRLAPVIYNGGSMVSVKDLAGVQAGFVGEAFVNTETRLPVTFNPSTTSTSATLLPEMSAFVVGGRIQHLATVTTSNSAANNTNVVSGKIDGAAQVDAQANVTLAAAYQASTAFKDNRVCGFGLHYVEQYWYVTGGTATSQTRGMQVEAKA